MKHLKRLLCTALSILFVLQLLTGCAPVKSDDEIYLTKGEFFAYFVYENGMTSEQYTNEDIQNCKDGSVEADIIAEWGYLPEDLAESSLKSTVTKEIVVMVCANATFDLKTGDPADIKDADLLKDPQLIADAYASDFFELENGYFDGAEKMTFEACEEILNNAKAYAANFHFEANTEITETAEGVIEQDSSNYTDGDIVLEFYTEEESPNDTADELNFDSCTQGMASVTQLGTIKSIDITNSENSGITVMELDNIIDPYGLRNVKGFSATIRKETFEKSLGNPNKGDVVVMNRYELYMATGVGYGQGEVVGILSDKKLSGANYICMFDYPDFETAAQKKNITESNRSKIDRQSFTIEKTEVAGWKLKFDVSSGGVKVQAEKAFKVQETGRKQDWQNASQTMIATANLEISDFNLDVKNLKSFATKKGEGYIKITCDTDVSFSLSQSLRYTPDSNRNGKFPSNWSNSRWTDADSKGAKSIKIAKFKPSLYGVATIDVYIYLLIAVDGKISFATSIDNGGVQITAKNGKISKTKLGTKESEFSANVNLHNRLGVDVSFKIFGFINVIEYDVGADLNLHAVVNLYYEDELSKSGVYADEEGLNEYAADDDKFSYCIGVTIEFGVSGKMKDSGVKMILDLISKGESLDFNLPIWSAGFHFEDGGFVEKCTHGEEEEKLDETDDEIKLSTYKVSMNSYTCTLVDLKAVPSKTASLMNSKNAVTVKSKNEDIVKAVYDPNTKTIMLEAYGEGSTEIIITAKQTVLWWKDTVTQEISVTVNDFESENFESLNYIIVDPASISQEYFI